MKKINQTHYFTFGSDHVLPDGSPAGGQYVKVIAPPGTDHRAVFMAWLGSNRFSSEYTLSEWLNMSVNGRYPSSPVAVIVITDKQGEIA